MTVKKIVTIGELMRGIGPIFEEVADGNTPYIREHALYFDARQPAKGGADSLRRI